LTFVLVRYLYMKIVICGSMAFSQKMIDVAKILKEKHYLVVLPEGVEEYIGGQWEKKLASGWNPGIEGAKKKMEKNLIRKYYQEISECDAILAINQDKHNIKNYIGGNTFLEMGFAHVLNKKIFVLNPLPEKLNLIYQELVAMRPIIINGDLKMIK